MGMQPIAPPLQSTMADLRSLLEIITDPKKLKDALESISKASEEMAANLAALASKEPELKLLSEKLEAKEKEIAEAIEKLNAKSNELASKAQAFSKREKDIEFREVDQAKRFEETQKGLDEALRTVAYRESMVTQKLFEATSLNASALISKKEYEEKLGKLKAMVGA